MKSLTAVGFVGVELNSSSAYDVDSLPTAGIGVGTRVRTRSARLVGRRIRFVERLDTNCVRLDADEILKQAFGALLQKQPKTGPNRHDLPDSTHAARFTVLVAAAGRDESIIFSTNYEI